MSSNIPYSSKTTPLLVLSLDLVLEFPTGGDPCLIISSIVYIHTNYWK